MGEQRQDKLTGRACRSSSRKLKALGLYLWRVVLFPQ